MTPISDVRSIIGSWPTRQDFASEIGQPIERVHKWAQKNAIPAWHQSRVLNACFARGLDVTAEQMMAMHASQEAAE